MYKKSVMHVRSCCFAYLNQLFFWRSLCRPHHWILKSLMLTELWQTDPTLLCYASAITEQKKCWELLAQNFDRFQTLSNNSQQHAIGWANGRNMWHPTMLGVVSQQCCVRLHGASVKHVAKRIVHFDWNISVTIVGSKETKQFCVVLHLCRS